MESAAGESNAPGTRWTRLLQTAASIVLVAVGAWHMVEDFRSLGAPDRGHLIVGAAMVVIGLLGLLRHASRLRRPVAGAIESSARASRDFQAPFRIPRSQRATTRLLVGGCLMCALSIIVMVLPWLHGSTTHAHALHPLVSTLIGLSGLLFFGSCLIWIARWRLDAGDALIADALGLYDRSNAVGEDERVPWREISGFRAVSFLGQAFVAVDLIDEDKFIDRAHGLRRLARSANRRLTGSPWCITPGVFGWSAAALAERLEAQRAQQLASR